MNAEPSPRDSRAPLPLLSAEGVSALLDERLSWKQAPVTLVLWTSDPAVVDPILARPDVTSVILPAPKEAKSALDPQHCGWWDSDTFGLVLPERLAQEIHCFLPGGEWGIGFQGAYRALRRGVRCVAFHDADIGTAQVSLLTITLQKFSKSLHYRLGQSRARRIVEEINRLSLKGIIRLIKTCRAERLCRPGRVMLVTGSLGSGGSERQSVNTLLGLKAAGVADLSLLHSHPLVPPYDFFHPALEGAGIPCLHLAEEAVRSRPLGEVGHDFLGILHGLERLGLSKGTILNYVRVFREHRPEIVHTWLDEINVNAGIAAVLAGVPKVVIGCRSLAPYHFPFYQNYMRSIYTLLAGQPNVTILNNSKAGAQDYRQWMGLDCPIQVIHNGFRFPSPSPGRETVAKTLRDGMGIGTNATVIGTVIRLSAEKQPNLWLDAAECVARQRDNACFVIIGDGPLMAAIEARIAGSPLRGRVKLLGKRRDVAELLSIMDVFVLTSAVEGLPNVLIEAQAEGVPVVASDVGGIREVFSDGDTGVIVPQPTAKGIADGVLRVLDDSALAQRARENAPGAMRKLFSIELMVRKTMEVYGMTADGSCR